MMKFVKEFATQENLKVIDIAASHLSSPFFSKFGAITKNTIKDGWGIGMHRVDMELVINAN